MNDDYYCSYAHLSRAGDFLEDHIETHGGDTDLMQWLEDIERIREEMSKRLEKFQGN